MRSGLIPLFMRKFIFARALKRKEMHFEFERTSLERRQNKTREWRGGTRRDPQLTSRLRPLLPPRGFVGPEGPLVRTFAKLSAELSLAIPPFLQASSAVRVFKGRTKATGNCCRLFRRYGRFYICPSLDRSSLLPPPPLSTFSLLRSHMPLFFFSFYLSFSSSTIDDFTSRYLPRRQEFR